MNSISTIQTDTSQIATAFPFGNDVVSNKLGDYVQKYKSIATKTAEHIIALASTLCEAKQELDDSEFQQFCHEVGLQASSSTYCKLMKIGLNSSRFTPYMHKMPNTWTTLYELAKLEAKEFDKVASSGVLSTFMSANELMAEIATSKESKPKAKAKVALPALSNSLVISFDSLSDEIAKGFYQELKQLGTRFGIVINLDPSLSAQLGG